MLVACRCPHCSYTACAMSFLPPSQNARLRSFQTQGYSRSTQVTSFLLTGRTNRPNDVSASLRGFFRENRATMELPLRICKQEMRSGRTRMIVARPPSLEVRQSVARRHVKPNRRGTVAACADNNPVKILQPYRMCAVLPIRCATP
jgi:hypothetical protein